MLGLDVTSFHGKVNRHSFSFMCNSEWEFNLKGTYCMCSYTLTVMKNLGIMFKKGQNSSLKHSCIFKVLFPLKQTVYNFLSCWPSSTKLKVLNSDKICANQSLDRWETNSLPLLIGNLWKNSLPGLSQRAWWSPCLFCLAMSTRMA